MCFWTNYILLVQCKNKTLLRKNKILCFSSWTNSIVIIHWIIVIIMPRLRDKIERWFFNVNSKRDDFPRAPEFLFIIFQLHQFFVFLFWSGAQFHILMISARIEISFGCFSLLITAESGDYFQFFQLKLTIKLFQ